VSPGRLAQNVITLDALFPVPELTHHGDIKLNSGG